MDLDVRWATSSFRITPGRDPLGLQTITTDRIMPVLTPGILALSQRARYFSFHLFLLHDYEQRRLPAARTQMSDFFRRREYELALATTFCQNGCGELAGNGVVGRDAIASPQFEGEAYARGFSVQSAFGAYGLYYRSPLITMGLVIAAGSALGGDPTPVDVIDPELGRAIAEAYRAQVEDTTYYREYIHSSKAVPGEVLEEYAEQACLCRLVESLDEQVLLRQAVFNPRVSVPASESEQRRRAFALFLSLLRDDPSIASSRSTTPFRSAIWRTFLDRSMANPDSIDADAFSEWAAVVAREALQEAVSSVWTGLCDLGLQRQGAYGVSDRELAQLIEDTIGDSPLELPDGSTVTTDPEAPLRRLITASEVGFSALEIEEIRTWVADRDSIIAGLAALIAIRRKLPDASKASRGWRLIGSYDGANQPGLLRMATVLSAFEENSETVGEFAHAVIRHLILIPHQRIASAKLPEFTFRFRIMDGRLRFFADTMRGHFGPSDIRHASLMWLSRDLGLWAPRGDRPELTPIGHELVQTVVG